MLGTSAQKTATTIRDFCSSADFLEYMFGGVQGVMYRATINPKYHQSYYRASGLIKARYAGEDNCYVAMNSFFRTAGLDEQNGRDVVHLKRLNAFYVDIDCYKVGLTKNEVLFRLENDYIGRKIPVPTFIIDSGRGIYLIWKLRNEDRKALPRWTAVQQYLTDTLEELGADHACTDAARILRVPFSRNPKSNTSVSIKEFNDLTYSIYDITKEYDIKAVSSFKSKKDNGIKKYPYNHATERQRKYVRDIANRLELPEESYPDFTNYHETDNWIKLHKDFSHTHREDNRACCNEGNAHAMPNFKSIKSILGSYCSEIRKLFSMRKGADCKRELALFLYRYFLREMKYDSDGALKETLAFNATLDCPFDETYVATVTASADRRVEKGIPYAYKKSTIISILQITEEELAELPFLAADVKSKTERRKESNRRAYESRLSSQGKVAKKDALLSRRASILAMQEQGKTATEIQQALHISRATYHRDVAALAVTSVLEAVRAVLATQAEKIMNTTKKAAETVSDAITSVKKTGVVAAIRAAHSKLKQTVQSGLSHFFSTPFIREYSGAVPHAAFSRRTIPKLRNWISRRRMGDRTSNEDGGDDSDGGKNG